MLSNALSLVQLVPFLLLPPIKTCYTMSCHAIQRCLQEISVETDMCHDDILINYFQKCKMDNTAYEHDLRHFNNNTKDAEVGYNNFMLEQESRISLIPGKERSFSQ